MTSPYPADRLPRFGFGLTTDNVEELRTLLREECREDVSLEEAWSRATSLLALTQLLLEQGDEQVTQADSAAVATSSHLTDSPR